VDWSLFGCARKGHVTYAPDEPDLRDRLMASTAGGTAWRCLRCGTFVTHGQHGKGHHEKVQHGSGPAAAAPLLRRGRELRDELILRVFAVERFIRFVVFAAAAFGVWRFKYDRGHIQQAFNHDLPAAGRLPGLDQAAVRRPRRQGSLRGEAAHRVLHRGRAGRAGRGGAG
jgi:hypothetical protein